MSKKHSIKEVQDFRDSVKRVVALLSGKNIPVAERGDDAYVRYNDDGEPILVNIPSIPDNATPALMNAVRGFLDHEVAHILFTDIRVSNKMREKRTRSFLVAMECLRRRVHRAKNGSGL